MVPPNARLLATARLVLPLSYVEGIEVKEEAAPVAAEAGNAFQA